MDITMDITPLGSYAAAMYDAELGMIVPNNEIITRVPIHLRENRTRSPRHQSTPNKTRLTITNCQKISPKCLCPVLTAILVMGIVSPQQLPKTKSTEMARKGVIL